MISLVFDDQKIEIIEEEKKYFSSEANVYIDTIMVDDIEKIVCQNFEGQLSAFYIVKKDKTEKIIVVDELNNTNRLLKMIEFLKSKGIEVDEI